MVLLHRIEPYLDTRHVVMCCVVFLWPGAASDPEQSGYSGHQPAGPQTETEWDEPGCHQVRTNYTLLDTHIKYTSRI